MLHLYHQHRLVELYNLQIRGAATGRSPLIIIDGMPTTEFQSSNNRGEAFNLGDLDASTCRP
jgi:hypothetical protein